MNVRQQIVENLKSQKTNATIASIAKAIKIDRTIVRYHLKALAKVGLAKVGRGTAGPNGSAPVALTDAKKATKEAEAWTPRAGIRKTAARRLTGRSLGGGKGGRKNGIGTSPKNGANGEVYLVTRDVNSGPDVLLAVSIFTDKEEAVAAVINNGDSAKTIYVGRRLSVAHTLVEE